MDAATFFLWSGGERPELLGMMCCHVDDLLFSGSEEAWASVGRLGEELGFGSVEKNDFVYCGKRVAHDLNTGVISVSMEAYVDNLVPIRVAASRRRDMDSALNPGGLEKLVSCVPWWVLSSGWRRKFELTWATTSACCRPSPRLADRGYDAQGEPSREGVQGHQEFHAEVPADEPRGCGHCGGF